VPLRAGLDRLGDDAQPWLNRTPRMPLPQLMMFDLDGTLVDTAGDIADALNELLREAGLRPASDDQVRRWVGHGSRRLLQAALRATEAPERADDDTVLDRLLARYQQFYVQRCGGRSACYPAVRETLARLQANGVKLAIVSNREAQLARLILASQQLDGCFGLVIGGDSLATKKPDALPVRHAMAYFGVSAGDALMIGDSVTDVGAAHAAGVRCWLLPYGYNGGQPVETAGADRIIERLDAVLALAAD